MSLNVLEIILGLQGGRTQRLEPKPNSINIVVSEEANLWHSSVVDILSHSGVRKNSTEAPFIRVRVENPTIAIAIADDMQAGLRIFEESIEQ